jgi:hypothetical protein
MTSNVTNLTQVFESGVALTALANSLLKLQGQEVKAIELTGLSESSQSNCNVAFVLLHEAGVPRILAPDDVAGGELDERAMVVLLTNMYRSTILAQAAARAQQRKARFVFVSLVFLPFVFNPFNRLFFLKPHCAAMQVYHRPCFQPKPHPRCLR